MTKHRQTIHFSNRNIQQNIRQRLSFRVTEQSFIHQFGPLQALQPAMKV